MTTKLLFIHALSPLHAGTGQSIGAVDLAIARDKATGFPIVPGSSIKGALRAKARQLEVPAERIVKVFGPETDRASESSGALIVSDANLLLLPVRSVAGTFAWATSMFLLQRLARDAAEVGGKLALPGRAPDLTKVVTPGGTKLAAIAGEQKAVFEDVELTIQKEADGLVTALTSLWRGDDAGIVKSWLEQRLAVVHDDLMAFLAQHGTDVVTRIALEADTKTVRKGGLWTEENLPAETVLVAMVDAMGPGRNDVGPVLDELVKSPVQLGGKATVGRGRCRLTLGGGR